MMVPIPQMLQYTHGRSYKFFSTADHGAAVSICLFQVVFAGHQPSVSKQLLKQVCLV